MNVAAAIRLCCQAAVLLAATSCATTGSSSDAEAAAHRLIMDYALLRDARDGAAFADLFTSDGRLTLMGETFVGRDAIRARLEGDSRAPSTLHLMSTVRINVDSPTRASGLSYATIFVGPPGPGPHDLAGFTAVGIYADRFERTREGWRIAERRFEPRLLPGSAKKP